MDRLKRLPQLPLREVSVNAAAVTGLSTLALSALIWCIRDYQAFLALGPGGASYNLKGWAWVTFLLRPLALAKRDATKVSDYPKDGAHDDIKNLPQRKGERAAVGGIVPHRQLSQYPTEEVKPYITNMFKNVVFQNCDLLEERLSIYERHNPAVFVREELLISQDTSVSKTAIIARGECGHIHPDFSIHLYFSPPDARLIIEKGWGERHLLSKPDKSMFKFKKGHIADTYLMIYGPRNEEEVDVVSKMLQNSIRFMTGREDIPLPPWRTALSTS